MCQFNPPLNSLLDMPVLKFKFIVIRCYKIYFFLLPRALATRRLLFCAITVKVLLCPPCFGLVAWPDVINSKYDEIFICSKWPPWEYKRKLYRFYGSLLQSGKLKGIWMFSVNYETNIYFDFEFFRFVYTL